jgi:hypothetical protein
MKPFGVNAPHWYSSFVVLDKSFLDAISRRQLEFYAQKGWKFGVTEALMHELLRKRDDWRIANLHKLHSIQKALVLLPGIGEMFRAEATFLKPASVAMKAKTIELIAERDMAGEFFTLTGETLRSVKERTDELDAKVPEIIELWRDFGRLPALRDAHPTELRSKADGLALEVRNDREAMRAFYEHHRKEFFPFSSLIDEEWAYYRWIQVHLVAGLYFYCSYGVNRAPSHENMVHELLDLDYLIQALLIGGLACRERRFRERFRLLHADGIILT